MAKQASIFSFFNKSKTPKKPVDETPAIIKLKGVEVEELTLVWGKVDGHPWWPGIVCYPPSGPSSFVRNKHLHLQFFEDPPTRGWVKESLLKPFADPLRVGIPLCKDSEWKTARARADAANKLSLEEKRALLVEHMDSDEEMWEEGSDGNSSKENMDDSNRSSMASPAEKKRSNVSANSGDEPSKKKRRIILKSDTEGSEDDYKPGKEEAGSSDESASSGVDEAEVSDSSDGDIESPSPAKPLKLKKHPPMNGTPKPYTPSAPPFTPYTPSAPAFNSGSGASPALKSKLALFSAPADTSMAEADTPEDWRSKAPFLYADKIVDSEGRRPSDPEYDCRTVRVSKEFLDQQTPGHRQWWIFKSKHYDTVLFFKMGKFYELFYMDAEIGVQELGLIMMKGNTPHSGFPEISYGRYSACLIDRGYKVARIEQTENPEMMEKRCRAMGRPTKFDRVVRREVCQLSSAGTRVWGVMDADPTVTDPANLLAITCKTVSEGDLLQFGVAFVDTSIGEFHIGQFTDDRHNSRLRTLLAHYPPVQVLFERGRLPAAPKQLVSAQVSERLLEGLASESEYWTAEKTITFLQEDGCFRAEDGSVQWPQAVKDVLEEDSNSAIEGESDLSLSSLGALVWYLKRCNLHSQILTRKLFKTYTPPDCQTNSEETIDESDEKVVFKQRSMVIDGGSATNLELLKNSSSGDVKGSLLSLLDHTNTPMGKRLLVLWISQPLVSCGDIDRRLDAIEELRNLTQETQQLRKILEKLPDLDRLLPKIHGQGLKFSLDDPNSRAIYYEEQKYSKKRVQSFLCTLQAFKLATTLPDVFSDSSVKSELLNSIISLQSNGGKFPDMKEKLRFFDNAFNHDQAKSEGKIIPSRGVDSQYDKALDDIDAVQQLLNEYLKDQCEVFKTKVVYWGSDRRRFQLEIPEHAAKKATTSYELVSQKKNFKRFWTSRCKELYAQMTAAEETKDVALKDIARRIFQQFDDEQAMWSGCVECLSAIDVMLSLTHYSNTVEAVRPVLHHPMKGQEPFLEIREGIHPCIGTIVDDIIPNDVVIGSEGGEGAHAPLVLVTGPNMGGKSTLMRQTALLTVMAQIGSYVPCASMNLTPVDRIFTRVGASDRMMAGESTFLLELRETAAILQHATKHALVLIDELGRGTATHDGTAVAWGVAGALVERGCRTLFSTHYHALVHHFVDTAGVSMGHMACMVEGDDEDIETGGEESITFLYKFIPGVCPKSYGFNAARLADIPQNVILSGRRAARLMEGRVDALQSFRKLFTGNTSVSDKRELIKKLAPVLKAVVTSSA